MKIDMEEKIEEPTKKVSDINTSDLVVGKRNSSNGATEFFELTSTTEYTSPGNPMLLYYWAPFFNPIGSQITLPRQEFCELEDAVTYGIEHLNLEAEVFSDRPSALNWIKSRL
jgi:hypothetical protein